MDKRSSLLYFLPEGSLLLLPEEETEYLLDGVVLVVVPPLVVVRRRRHRLFPPDVGTPCDRGGGLVGLLPRLLAAEVVEEVAESERRRRRRRRLPSWELGDTGGARPGEGANASAPWPDSIAARVAKAAPTMMVGWCLLLFGGRHRHAAWTKFKRKKGYGTFSRSTIDRGLRDS